MDWKWIFRVSAGFTGAGHLRLCLANWGGLASVRLERWELLPHFSPQILWVSFSFAFKKQPDECFPPWNCEPWEMPKCIPRPLKDTVTCVYWSGKMLVMLSDLSTEVSKKHVQERFQFSKYVFIYTCMYRETQILMRKRREAYTSNVSSGYSTRWWNFIIFCLCLL